LGGALSRELGLASRRTKKDTAALDVRFGKRYIAFSRNRIEYPRSIAGVSNRAHEWDYRE
jgi:hypothetical protein